MNKMKTITMSVIGVLLFIVGFYFIKTVAQPQGIMKTIPYLLIGIGCGTFGHGIGEFFSELAMKKDPKLAKQKEIDEKDERNIILSNMSKAKGYDIMCYVFAALLLAYALMGASMEIIIPFVLAFVSVQLYTIFILIKKHKEN